MELTESRKRLIIDLISEFKKSDSYSLYKTEFNRIVNNENELKTVIEILKYKLEFITSPTKETYRLTKKGIVFSSFEDAESASDKIIMNSFNNSTIGQFNQDSNFFESPNNIKTKAAPSNNPVIKSRLKTILSNPWFIGISLALLAAILNGKRFMSFINNMLDNF
ncbi:hypothetical protein [Flavobacterium tiangeerense]|uniref:hypothetical protein n=1 Tax=Flavobacterium tiangeerense TaxID=459471 RepID=UPI0011A0D019|nr:hypothetical protein [Flavobacterium tiangeerense]